MSDSAKKKVILFLGSFDRISTKATKNKDFQRSTGVESGTSKEVVLSWADELDTMSSKELTGLMWKSILFSLPIILLILLCIIGVGYFVYMNLH